MSIAYKGFLIKRGQKVKNWKTRFFVLYDHGQLSYFKIKDEPEDLMTLPSPTGTLDLSKPNTLVLAGSSMPTIDWPSAATASKAFCIQGPERTIFIFWHDADIVSTWMDALNKVIDNLKRSSNRTAQTLPPAKPAPYRPAIVENESDDDEITSPREPYSEVRIGPAGMKRTVHVAPDGTVTMPPAAARAPTRLPRQTGHSYENVELQPPPARRDEYTNISLQDSLPKVTS
eukprot:TRINITY_DN11101_c0_g3_i2.p1 TRINITY_DN11101_c0_g3~~TRINITY_DN11101_c0_g3_i2.p1  ORF type:complete len:230 (+),score=6.53 TRINITY_DN11101_c0_g3_i2:60-749(+)